MQRRRPHVNSVDCGRRDGPDHPRIGSDCRGLLFARTSGRIGELKRELGTLHVQLRAHQAAAPPELDDNPGLLTWLPRTKIDLTRLATARLRRFLDAFRVEVHYDVRTGRATFRATISAGLIDQLTQQIRRIENASPSTRHPEPGLTMPSSRENAAQTSEGSSFGLCPRRDTTQNCSPSGQLLIAADLPIYVRDG